MLSMNDLTAVEVTLVKKNENGSVTQILLNDQQNEMLHIFLAALAKWGKFKELPPQCDLIRKDTVYDRQRVEKLLETQRGNCAVAIMSATTDKNLVHLVSAAPEPAGGLW